MNVICDEHESLAIEGEKKEGQMNEKDLPLKIHFHLCVPSAKWTNGNLKALGQENVGAVQNVSSVRVQGLLRGVSYVRPGIVAR